MPLNNILDDEACRGYDLDVLLKNKPTILCEYMQFFKGYFMVVSKSHQKILVPMSRIIHMHVSGHGAGWGRIIMVGRDCLYIWEEDAGRDVYEASLQLERVSLHE